MSKTISLVTLPRIRGFVFYDGPSQINGKPIIGVATLKTDNPKTGDMVQTWIINKNESPTDSIFRGTDDSICGDCKHRGNNGKGRSCYVSVANAPYQIFKAYQENKYPPFNQGLTSLVKGRKTRLGAYGDPCAVPYEVWTRLLEGSAGWTGYTHAFKYGDQRFKNICMASVDSEEEFAQAKEMGWRAFRVRNSEDLLLKGEFMCPASEEGGKRLTCEDCLACSGTRFDRVKGGDVSIIVHGRKAARTAFSKQVALAT